MSSFWNTLFKKTSNDDNKNVRRKYVRRTQDTCVITIDDKQYPIRDWSMGGALIEAQSRIFEENEYIDFTIKFRLNDRVLEIDHSGLILRKNKTLIALQFDPLPGATENAFTEVIDDSVSSSVS